MMMIVNNINEEERSRVIKEYEALSIIHDVRWKQLYKDIAKGERFIDSTISLPSTLSPMKNKKNKNQQQVNESEDFNDTGLTYLHAYALECDIPLIKEMLRLGATLDIVGPNGETPMYVAAININTPKEYRILEVEAVRYFLEVGANPNVKQLVPNGKPYTALHGACMKCNMELCEVLLQYGADPSVKDFQNRTPQDYLNKKNRDIFQKLCTEYSSKNKPPKKCQCGSGKLFDLCHGTDNVPLEDNMFCCCLSGKLYSKCCKKRGILYCRNAKFDHFEVRHMTTNVNNLIHYMKEKYDRDGEINPGDYMFADDNGQPISYTEKDFVEYYNPLVDAGLVDRAYVYALSQHNMFVAMPWIGPASFPTHERKLRKEEWNNHIDTYINDVAHKLGDFRDRQEIERACKISENGGPLYKHCGNPKCDKKTIEERLFKRCSQCKYTL
jgi:hypothetical protein